MAEAIGGTAVTTLSSAGAYNAEEAEETEEAEEESETSQQENKTSGKHGHTWTISIETIIISAFIFIAIYAWFEFIRAWFDVVFSPINIYPFEFIYNRLWYAIFITALALVLIYVVYHIVKSMYGK